LGVTQIASPYIAYAILGDDVFGLIAEFLTVKRGQGGGEVDIGERRVIIRYKIRYSCCGQMHLPSSGWQVI